MSDEPADDDGRATSASWQPPLPPGRERRPSAAAATGVVALESDAPPLLDALGGPLGIAESVLPSAAFVSAYTIAGQDTRPGLILALALGAGFALARIVRGQTPQFALAGLAGIGISAYVVARTGKAENFFLPGLLANAGYALGYAVSIAVRWPLLGVVLALVSNRGMEWREDPDKLRSYTRASWVWVALFSLRLAVQLPLYLTGAVVALGVTRVAMGVPLFAVGIWLSWLILRPRRA